MYMEVPIMSKIIVNVGKARSGKTKSNIEKINSMDSESVVLWNGERFDKDLIKSPKCKIVNLKCTLFDKYSTEEIINNIKIKLNAKDCEKILFCDDIDNFHIHSKEDIMCFIEFITKFKEIYIDINNRCIDGKRQYIINMEV